MNKNEEIFQRYYKMLCDNVDIRIDHKGELTNFEIDKLYEIQTLLNELLSNRKIKNEVQDESGK